MLRAHPLIRPFRGSLVARSRRPAQRSPARGPRLLWRCLCGLALLSWVGACRPKPGPNPEPSSSAEQPPPPPPPRCAEVSQGASFLIGKPSTQAEPEQQALDLPFAVEIGGARSLASGYLVTALRSVGKQTHAMLASVSGDSAAGRVIELGRVHGDVEPPTIATRKERVVVGVVDHDASGSIVRLATVSQAATNPNVTWGALPSIGSDESQAFDIALGDSRGVLVWDDFKRADGYGSVWSLSFNLDDPSSVTPARVVSLKGQDVEAPQLAERPGGFWLAWVAHSKLGKPAPASKEPPSAELDSEELIDLGKRWIEVVRLDENGVRQGEPVQIGSKDAHVLVFDLSAGPDGSAWLAWRDDATSPGAERRTVLLASVSAAGDVTESKLEDERVGAGVPRLLGVEGASGMAAWLTLGTVGDRTTFVALSSGFKLLDALDNDPLVGSADMLAAHGDRVLLSNPRGLAAELSVARCVHREAAAGPTAGAHAAASGQPEVAPPPNEEAAGDSPVAAPDPS